MTGSCRLADGMATLPMTYEASILACVEALRDADQSFPSKARSVLR